MTHPLLPQHTSFQEETYEEANSRYEGFSSGLFAALKTEMPAVFQSLQFYRYADDRTADMFAVCDWSHTTFAIQLDPDCEVICLWSGPDGIEIGDWEPDPIVTAIEHIRTNFTAET